MPKQQILLLMVFGTLLIVTLVTISLHPAFADMSCLEEQRYVRQLEREGDNFALGAGANVDLSGGNQACAKLKYAKWDNAKAAFIRHCYRELGMTELQGDDEASQAENEAAMFSREARRCR